MRSEMIQSNHQDSLLFVGLSRNIAEGEQQGQVILTEVSLDQWTRIDASFTGTEFDLTARVEKGPVSIPACDEPRELNVKASKGRQILWASLHHCCNTDMSRGLINIASLDR